MHWSPERLRWLLLGGVLGLAAVIAALFGLSTYRAGKIWQRILARNGVNIRRESNGLTYSQSKGGRTIFTIHAGRSVPHGEGQWTLEDAVLILYGKDGRNDRISGNQFEYDEKAGVLRAIGEVHLDLDAPNAGGGPNAPALSFTPNDATAADPALIHVRTSGLVYTRKLGIAVTDQPTEFRYRGMLCLSRGAEFDAGNDVLRLPGDVHLVGKLRDLSFTLTAASSTLNRQSSTVELQGPVYTTEGRMAEARYAVLHLRADGSLETGDADGDVRVRSNTMTVEAPRAHASFAEGDHPRDLRFEGGVAFADADPSRPLRGEVQTADASLDEAGMLREVVGHGAVRLSTQASGMDAGPRELMADVADASFSPPSGHTGSAELRTLKLSGHAELSGASGVGGKRPAATTKVSGDLLTASFASEGAQLQRLVGSGHTQIEQVSADGASLVSTGEMLDASFASRAAGGAASLEVSEAVQTGSVVVRSTPAPKSGGAAPSPIVGQGAKADFAAAQGTLTLTGTTAQVQDAETVLRAPVISLHQGTGDAEASGGVAATSGGTTNTAATHVLADHAALLRGPQLSEFFGGAGRPAQLWQGGSQVRAAQIVLDGLNHSLSAHPDHAGEVVETIFAEAAPLATGGSKQPGGRMSPSTTGVLGATRHPPAAGREAVLVRAGSVVFSDTRHECVFGGGVEMLGPEGRMTGDRGVAFLDSRPASDSAPSVFSSGVSGLSARLERIVLLGSVQLRQPGRTGTGAQLTYIAAKGNYVLTGTPGFPARIVDVQQGTVAGATLLFDAAQGSIVVAGEPGGVNQRGPTRVHTETDLRPQ